jgi:hypothetical protein
MPCSLITFDGVLRTFALITSFYIKRLNKLTNLSIKTIVAIVRPNSDSKSNNDSKPDQLNTSPKHHGNYH